MRRAWTAMVLAAAAVLTGCGTAPSVIEERAAVAEAQAASRVSQAGGRTLGLTEAVRQLTVAAEGSRRGYDRRRFRVWKVDADHDGCDARRETLLAEAVKRPEVGPKCRLRGGEWDSYLDGAHLDGAVSVSVDHTVALAEAWDSGASKWPERRLAAYGNDLADPEHLIGVSEAANTAKGDLDVGQWRPAKGEAACRLVAAAVGVKLRWQLTVDPAEYDTVAELADPKYGLCRLNQVHVYPTPR